MLNLLFAVHTYVIASANVGLLHKWMRYDVVLFPPLTIIEQLITRFHKMSDKGFSCLYYQVNLKRAVKVPILKNRIQNKVKRQLPLGLWTKIKLRAKKKKDPRMFWKDYHLIQNRKQESKLSHRKVNVGKLSN